MDEQDILLVNVVCFCVYGLTGIIGTTIFIPFYKRAKEHYEWKGQKMNPTVKLGLYSTFSWVMTDFFAVIGSSSYFILRNPVMSVNIGSLGYISWCIALSLWFFWILSQLKSTFQDTVYKPRNKNIKCLNIFASITIILLVVYVALILISNNVSQFDDLQLITAIVFLLFSSLATMYVIIVQCIFSKTLLLVSINMRQSIDGDDDNDMSDHQIKIIDLIAKRVLLTLVGCIAAIIWQIVFIITVIIASGNNYANNSKAQMIVSIVWNSYTCIVQFCIVLTGFLGNVFTDKEYYTICQKCHKYFLSMYQEKATIEIHKKVITKSYNLGVDKKYERF